MQVSRRPCGQASPRDMPRAIDSMAVSLQIQVSSRVLRSSVRPFTPASVRAPRALVVSVSASDRLRLHNLSPEPGSRRDEKRKGRGYAAGQVWSSFCGAQQPGGWQRRRR